MDKTLTCDCGYEARAGDSDALAAEVQHRLAGTWDGALASEALLPSSAANRPVIGPSYHTN